MYSGPYNMGRMLLEIMGIEMWKWSVICWMRTAKPCLRIVLCWDTCRTLVAPLCKAYLNIEVQKAYVWLRTVFVDYPFPVSSWAEAMSKVELPAVRIQPVDCQLYRSFDIKRLDFIRAFSDLSILKTKPNLPYGKHIPLWEFGFALCKDYRSWLFFFFPQYFVWLTQDSSKNQV